MKKKFYSFWGVSQLLVGAMTIGLVSCEKSSELLYDFSETSESSIQSRAISVADSVSLFSNIDEFKKKPETKSYSYYPETDEFIKKAQIISAEISRYFSSDIQISYNTRKRINPQMRSPLCMVLENFNEKGFCKYYHEATNMEYLYDPTTKLCFSFFADERDESLLEVYGLSSWASNLVEKQISIATLANLYTIIGL